MGGPAKNSTSGMQKKLKNRQSEPSNIDCDSVATAHGDSAEKENARQGPDKEIGGRKGPEPTRFGDWEKDGRCIDF